MSKLVSKEVGFEEGRIRSCSRSNTQSNIQSSRRFNLPSIRSWGRVSSVLILGSSKKLVSCLIIGIGAKGKVNSWKCKCLMNPNASHSHMMWEEVSCFQLQSLQLGLGNSEGLSKLLCLFRKQWPVFHLAALPKASLLGLLYEMFTFVRTIQPWWLSGFMNSKFK